MALNTGTTLPYLFLFLRVASCCVYYYNLFGFRQSQLYFLSVFIITTTYPYITCITYWWVCSSNDKKHSKSTVAIDGTQKDCYLTLASFITTHWF
jgi:hypothetical protein